MDTIGCYLSTSRIALQAVCTDPTTWQEMHTLLPDLHEHLSCRVCHKLLDQPNTCLDGFACMGCINYQTNEKKSTSIIQCYKKLCAYIYRSPLYSVMCTRDEDSRLVEIVTEVIGVSRPINGHNGLVSGSVNTNQLTEELDNLNNIELNTSLDVQIPIENKTSKDCLDLQMFDVQSRKHRIQNQSVHYTIPKKKKNERRWGCRCGNATSTPGKLTCFGQRCPCYTEQKSCDQCKCRGCRNPRQKPSNNDANIEVDKIRLKPVTLELVSSLKPSHIKSEPAFSSYMMHDMLQFPSHSRNYSQTGDEVTLGHVNSIFHSS